MSGQSTKRTFCPLSKLPIRGHHGVMDKSKNVPKDAPIAEVRRVQPQGDPDKLRLALSMNLCMIVAGKVGDMDSLKTVLEHAVDLIQAECKKLDIDAYLHTADVRPAHHDLLLAVYPRRVHFVQGGRQICDTAHVSTKNLTKNEAEVTCKLCRKRMAICSM